MAFVLADPVTLARDLWPHSRGRLIRDMSDVSTLKARQLVPLEYEDLSQWLSVDPCGLDASCAAWGHPDVSEENQTMEVTVRLNGFVEKASLGMLGDWDGKLTGAPKAVQSLSLVSGGCAAAFDPQLAAVENVKERVLSFLGRGSETTEQTTSNLVLRRRVFQKVGGTGDETPAVVVPVAEDPLRRARKIEHMWSVNHHIVGGIQQPDGRVTRANPSVIRAGDFVDVCVTVQVVSFRLPRGKRGVDVMFVPQTVVRMCSVEQSVMMLRSIANEGLQEDLYDGPGVTRRDIGIEFDTEEEGDATMH